MLKTEVYYNHKKGVKFSQSILKIDERIMTEFNLLPSGHGYRRGDNSFGVTINKDKRYHCDTHEEFLDVLNSVPYFESFNWHKVYKEKPREIKTKISRLFSSKTEIKYEGSELRFGLWIDYSKYEIEVGIHAENNLSFIERAHSIVRDELGLERPERMEKDDYRRKMLEPKIFIARHFDQRGNSYYSTLYNFLSTLGFQVAQGEEYQSTDIPDKVKHKIDQNEIVLVNFSGDRSHDWLISEASYSLGKNKHLIRIVESTTDVEPGIIGKDNEYIKYPENEIEKIFIPLLREFRSVGIKGIFF
jgi:hypothetical protein